MYTVIVTKYCLNIGSLLFESQRHAKRVRKKKPAKL